MKWATVNLQSTTVYSKIGHTHSSGMFNGLNSLMGQNMFVSDWIVHVSLLPRQSPCAGTAQPAVLPAGHFGSVLLADRVPGGAPRRRDRILPGGCCGCVPALPLRRRAPGEADRNPRVAGTRRTFT